MLVEVDFGAKRNSRLQSHGFQAPSHGTRLNASDHVIISCPTRSCTQLDKLFFEQVEKSIYALISCYQDASIAIVFLRVPSRGIPTEMSIPLLKFKTPDGT